MADAVRVIISGRVQGVGYRAWTVQTASELGLKGWVRNLSDGNVEPVFSGTEIHIMLEACKKGPPAARVNDIKIFHHEETLDGPFTTQPTV